MLPRTEESSELSGLEASLALVAPALLGEEEGAGGAVGGGGDGSGDGGNVDDNEKNDTGNVVDKAGDTEFDPEHMDSVGRTVWVGQLEFVMDPFSKQVEQSAFDLTDEMREHWCGGGADAAAAGIADAGSEA